LGFGIHAAATMRGGIDKRWLPVDACSFITQTQLPGRFFNDYQFGGYWMWQFGTTRPVFIDGRYHMVDGYPELLEKMTRAKASWPKDWNAFLKSYGVDAAIVVYPEKYDIPHVLDFYFPRKYWALIYADGLAQIFVRRQPVFKPWIDQYEIMRKIS